MNLTVDFRVLELLCGRLCHELISPIGAINNGVELLGEDDPDFVKDAMALIGQSGRKAGQRLQFYRFAYGTSATGAAAGGGAANGRELAAGLLDGGKVACDWSAEAAALPVEWQKIACNMLVLAVEALPRGGAVRVAAPPSGGPGVEVSGEGPSINLTPEVRAAIADGTAVDALTSRTVHAYFSARLAGLLGARLTVDPAPPDRLVLSALPAP
jgi:histidine phosphotransferase ChpT